MQTQTITNDQAEERLDKFIAETYDRYSRSALSKLIDSGEVTVNSKQMKSNYRLKVGDVVRVNLATFEKIPENITIPILFEDKDVAVLYKDAGVLTHAKGALHNEATVATFIKSKLLGSTTWKDSNRAGIVHRLDRATSGVIICAKTEEAQQYLQKQFAKRNVKKTYLAIVSGALPAEGVIEVPIERNPKKPATFRAGSNGKVASTHFKVISHTKKYTLVELSPTTGRTHQLRVHLAYLKHPIVGDVVYKGEPAKRMLLHAQKLELTLPSGERKVFEASLPKEFVEYS